MNIMYEALMKRLREMERSPESMTDSDKAALEKIYGLLTKDLGISESAKWVVEAKVRKYADRESYSKDAPYETRLAKQNIVTDAGATAILKLMCGTGGTAFDSANAYIGVGDTDTAADVSDTDLKATDNKLRKQVDGTYPQVSGRSVTFKATFNESEANFDWKEFGIFNAGEAGTMLNRKVQDFGRKAAGIWSIEIQISVTSNA